MKKITFAENQIFVDGDNVGRLDGTRGEVWVVLRAADKSFQTIARFKYARAKASAKHWLKFILAVRTSEEIVAALQNQAVRETPLGLAEKLGYVSLNMLEAQKRQVK